jgi:hypothetical protein
MQSSRVIRRKPVVPIKPQMLLVAAKGWLRPLHAALYATDFDLMA